jgi:hypothetical protein
MSLIGVIAIMCAIAGGTMIVLGFMLGLIEGEVRRGVRETLKGVKAATPPQAAQEPGIAGTVEQQAAILSDLSELNKSLAELAKALTGLSLSVQVFIISIIFFALAAGLATVNQLPN